MYKWFDLLIKAVRTLGSYQVYHAKSKIIQIHQDMVNSHNFDCIILGWIPMTNLGQFRQAVIENPNTSLDTDESGSNPTILFRTTYASEKGFDFH
jgi:hypothetical protein